MSYMNRRYLVVDGVLKKSWANPPSPDWFIKKSDALADHERKAADAKVRDKALAAEAKVRDDELAAEEAAAKKVKADEKATAEAAQLAEKAIAATKLAEEAAAKLTNGGGPATANIPAVESPDPTTSEPEAAEAAPETPPEAAPEPDPDPTPPGRMLRMTDTMTRTNKTRVTIQREVAAGIFPQPYDLGRGEWAWHEKTIEALQRDRPDEPTTPDPEAS